MTDTADTTEARIERLERRLQHAEDRLELLQIIAAYGPAVDSGSPEVTAQMWTEDGTYDTSVIEMRGRDELRAMVLGERHQGLINAGAAHLQGIPHIDIDGDTATVTHYSQLAIRDADSDSFRIWRTGVNRWTFVRTADGWKATHRVNQQLDGSDAGRRLLAMAVDTAQQQG